MIEVTCTLSPPIADTTLPHTSVAATTFTCSPAFAAGLDAESSADVPEQAPSAKTDKAEAAASTALVRREVIGALLIAGIANGNRCQIHLTPSE
ncbi:hypothetical protein GCM10022222_45180 [Amycolatopsis ultiminotia]|uniref:Uncharacterized protein n=1 Tax=Amycolatopsis ultiminotia TaxID=543629 RepID=A0ABP6WW00_9PSEU